MLCVVDIFSKYALAAPLKDEKCIRIINAFQKILDDSSRKPYKIWVAKGSKICKKPMKTWLKFNDIVFSTIYRGRTIF